MIEDSGQSTPVVHATGLQPYIGQAGDHQRISWIGGSVMSVLLDGDHSGGQLTILRTRLQRGDASPMHVHGNEDEVLLLLQGAAVIWVGDERYEVNEGGLAFLPRGIPHAYRFTSETADLLTLCAPAGLEAFFREAGHDLSQPAPEGWSPSTPAMAEAMSRHGGRIVGPPKSAAD